MIFFFFLTLLFCRQHAALSERAAQSGRRCFFFWRKIKQQTAVVKLESQMIGLQISATVVHFSTSQQKSVKTQVCEFIRSFSSSLFHFLCPFSPTMSLFLSHFWNSSNIFNTEFFFKGLISNVHRVLHTSQSRAAHNKSVVLKKKKRWFLLYHT